MTRHHRFLFVLLGLLALTSTLAALDFPSVVFFGRIPYDESVTESVEIHNDLDSTVYFDFISTCACVTVVPESVSIAGDEKATIEVTLDPRQYSGDVQKMVIVRSNLEEYDREPLQVYATVDRPPDAQALGCTDCELLAQTIEEEGLRHWLDRNWVVVDIFYTEGCHECEELVGDTIPEISHELSIETSIRRHNVLDPEQYELLVAEMDRRGVELSGFPVVVVGDSVLAGSELSPDGLTDALAVAAGKDATTAITGVASPSAEANAAERGDRASTGVGLAGRLGFFPVLVAGLVDGVNPCAFATLLFLLSSLAVVGKNKRETLVIGLVFAGSVFVTYFTVGLGLFQALRAATLFPTIAAVIRWVMVAALAVFAALSLYDYFLIRRGRASDMVLQLPDKFKRRIHTSVREGVRGSSLILGSAVMGILVSLFELGCTGQVYLPTISYMVQTGEGLLGYGLLVVYNVGFIAPLLFLFAAVYFGVGSDKLLKWFQVHLGALKLALAAVFVVLAILMVIT